MSASGTYTRGLHELGDALHAFLQPNGGWGLANAGLIVGDGAALLVDTLFDLALTREMLDAMAPLLEASPLGAAVNTHANGDHCFGNVLLPEGLPIHATAAAAAEMRAAPPSVVNRLMNETDLGPEFAAFARDAFGAFTFEGIEPREPTELFETEAEISVGGRTVRLLTLGPAHTYGDARVHVPDADAVFTGDLLFARCTPMVWAGPISGFITAAQRILDLSPMTIVPGHGPLADAGTVRDMQEYLRFVMRESEIRFHGGLDPVQAADDIDLGPYRDWGDAERIAGNVDAAYRELDPSRPVTPVPELFLRMAHWRARH